MNRQFNEYISYKALGVKLGSTTFQDIATDQLLEENNHNLEIKNVCTKMSKDLSDRIDSTVNFLDIRKRKFIELAIIQALDAADEIIANYISNDDDWIESQKTGAEK